MKALLSLTFILFSLSGCSSQPQVTAQPSVVAAGFPAISLYLTNTDKNQNARCHDTGQQTCPDAFLNLSLWQQSLEQQHAFAKVAIGQSDSDYQLLVSAQNAANTPNSVSLQFTLAWQGIILNQYHYEVGRSDSLADQSQHIAAQLVQACRVPMMLSSVRLVVWFGQAVIWN